MSTFEYKYAAENGPDFHVRKLAGSPNEIWISTDNAAFIGTYIPNADVPTVAAEMLQAAGHHYLAGYIEGGIDVQERTERVEAEAARIVEAVSPRGLTRCHLCNDGIAQAKAAREAVEKILAEAAEKRLQERRDALAKKYHGRHFVLVGEGGQRVINDIIELQDKLNGASRD